MEIPHFVPIIFTNITAYTDKMLNGYVSEIWNKLCINV